MVSKQKYLRIGVVLLPALIFILSLTQDAFSYQHIQKEVAQGFVIFLMGGTAILGGGLFEWFIWLANPIAIISCIRFLRETNSVIKIEPVLLIPISNPKPSSYWLSIIAAAVAWSFSFWNEILAAESGSMGKILSLGSGYWFWASSLTILAIGINFYYILNPRMTD